MGYCKPFELNPPKTIKPPCYTAFVGTDLKALYVATPEAICMRKIKLTGIYRKCSRLNHANRVFETRRLTIPSYPETLSHAVNDRIESFTGTHGGIG